MSLFRDNCLGPQLDWSSELFTVFGWVSQSEIGTHVQVTYENLSRQ